MIKLAARACALTAFALLSATAFAQEAGSPRTVLIESGAAKFGFDQPYSGVRIYSDGTVEEFNELPRFSRPPWTIATAGPDALKTLGGLIQNVDLAKTPLAKKPRGQVCFGGLRSIIRVNQGGAFAVIRDDNGPCDLSVPTDAHGAEDHSEFVLSQLMGAWATLGAFSAPPIPLGPGSFFIPAKPKPKPDAATQSKIPDQADPKQVAADQTGGALPGAAGGSPVKNAQ